MGDYFATYNIRPSYKDPETLRKFISPRGKLLPREKTRLTAKSQREVAHQVKLARYMGLLPYTAYQTEKVVVPAEARE